MTAVKIHALDAPSLSLVHSRVVTDIQLIILLWMLPLFFHIVYGITFPITNWHRNYWWYKYIEFILSVKCETVLNSKINCEKMFPKLSVHINNTRYLSYYPYFMLMCTSIVHTVLSIGLIWALHNTFSYLQLLDVGVKMLDNAGSEQLLHPIRHLG